MEKTNAIKYKIRGRIPRLLLGFFLPPFLGALFMYFYFGYTESGIFKDPKILLIMIFSAFVYVGIPAFIYSLSMEYLFVPQAKIGALTAIGALLGGISGATPILIIDGLFFIKNNFEFFSLTIMLGVSIGVITSLILKRNYKKHYGEFD